MDPKSQAFKIFKNFKALVENKMRHKIKILKFDRRGDYISQEFKKFLKDNGILNHKIHIHNSYKNRMTKKINRTLLTKACSILIAYNTLIYV